MTARRTLLLTVVAVIAFAANSILCRLALAEGKIDAASFTTLRLCSGALTLWLLIRGRGSSTTIGGSWVSGSALLAYAAAFSFAYVSLEAAVGALILFGAVQATMIMVGLVQGERLRAIQVLGLGLAMAGLVYLLLPGLSAPPLGGSLLMLLSGVAWGVYSLLGRGNTDPSNTTAGNFLRAAPLALVISIISVSRMHVQPEGILYAVLSGSITSGLGYVVWYAALRGLSATRAATVQLSVPVIAAIAAVLLLGEAVTQRLLLASLAILGGISLVITRRT